MAEPDPVDPAFAALETRVFSKLRDAITQKVQQTILEEFSDENLAQTIRKLAKKEAQRQNLETKAQSLQTRVIISQQEKLLREINALRRPFIQPPSVILEMIFERTYPPAYLLDHMGAISPHSFASLAIRQQKSIMSVCKLWYDVAKPSLYENVFIKRPDQLFALRRSLEASPSDGSWIRALHIYCLIPNDWETRFSKVLQFVINYCTRLVRFSFSSTCRTPPDVVMPSFPFPITHLDVGGYDFSAEQVADLVLPLSQTLVRLSFDLPDVPKLRARLIGEDGKFTLPFLQAFDMQLSSYGSRRDVLFLEQWIMPSLERITFKIGDLRSPIDPSQPAHPMNRIASFLSIHGKRVKYLHFQPKYRCFLDEELLIVQPALDRCPVLEHLVLHPQMAGPVSHPNVRWVDIWQPYVSPWYGKQWRVLRDGINLIAFPELRGIRVLARELGFTVDLPLHLPPGSITRREDSFELEFLDLHVRHEFEKVFCIGKLWTEGDRWQSSVEEDPDYFPDSDSEYTTTGSSSDDSSEGDTASHSEDPRFY